MEVHFSSKRSDWETPQELFDAVNKEFGFTLDVCATSKNAKCERYYTPEDDGLAQPWEGVCWMNPPYGRQITKWVERAYHETRKPGTTVVALLPARTDTQWWHDFVMKSSEIRFVKGRLKFVGAENSAPFPSVIVVWRPLSLGPPTICSGAAKFPMEGRKQ